MRADGECVIDYFFFSSRRRHTRFDCDWSSDVCSSDLGATLVDDGGQGWSSTGAWNTASSSTDIKGGLHWTATTGGPATATATWQPQIPRSEERRVGKSVDLGGRRIIKKKKKKAKR